MEKTKPLRSNKDTNLFISFVKPHKNVGRSTIGRWIKSGVGHKKAVCQVS